MICSVLICTMDGWFLNPAMTEDEPERADLHLGYCPACQVDMDFDFLMSQLGENNSRL
jgi:hypothetical protein